MRVLIPLALAVLAAPAAAQKPLTVAELVRQVTPAVVYIETYDASGQQEALGSGFIADASGLIVTNLHVIAGSAAVTVKLADGDVYDRVEVLDFDQRRDLAVLRIRPFTTLPVLTLADSDGLEVGEEAVAVGNPKGLEHTVTAGLVSAFRQWEGYRVIQISVPISPGSSGGPLFDRMGRVIGVTTAQLRGEGTQNLNFAVPINYAKPLLRATTPALTMAEVNARIGATPSAAAAVPEAPAAPPPAAPGTPATAGFGPLPRAEGIDADWWAYVAHDHVSGEFSDFCVGLLLVKGDSVGFATPSGLHDWSSPASGILEARKNRLNGIKYNAFHIRLANGANYNLAVLDEQGMAIPPDAVLELLGRIVKNR
ncbi:MAG: S1C family serine protease [Vicinamibacterales bacterium]